MKKIEKEEVLENGNFKLEVRPEIKTYIDQVLDDFPQVVGSDTKCYYEKASIRSVSSMYITPPMAVRKALTVKDQF